LPPGDLFNTRSTFLPVVLYLAKGLAQRFDIEAIDAAAPIFAATIPVVYVAATNPTVTATATSVTIAISAAQVSVSAAIIADENEHTMEKRATVSVSCLPQPSGIDHKSSEDTAQAFLRDPYYANIAKSASTPQGYTTTFMNLNASNNAYGYLGYSLLQQYDVEACAAKCDEISVCQAENIYFERDPGLEPDSPSCANPASTTQIKCVLWSGPVTVENAVNTGQWRNSFQVAITGSNGYVNKSIDTPPGYSGAIYLGSSTINSTQDCNHDDSYLGMRIFTNEPFDASLCATACSAMSIANKAADPSTPTCQFFTTYLLYKNGKSVGRYCSMYSRAWSSSFATNTGFTSGTDRYTIGFSYAFVNTSSNGIPTSACIASSSSISPQSIISSALSSVAASLVPIASTTAPSGSIFTVDTSTSTSSSSFSSSSPSSSSSVLSSASSAALTSDYSTFSTSSAAVPTMALTSTLSTLASSMPTSSSSAAVSDVSICETASDCSNNTAKTICANNICATPGSMTDSHNCGYDPTWIGRDCGDFECFGGRCVFDTCAINQTTIRTRINLGIGNGTNVYYLAWYYAEDGSNPPDSIALASTVPPTLGLFFAPSEYNPGFYDLRVENYVGLFLGYSPATGYMVWNHTAGPNTGIWRADGCDGDMVMTYNGQTYHFATDKNNYAVALPDTTSSLDKRFSINYSNFVPFAIRNKATFISASRCQSSSPAQRVPLSDPSLAPNGCGSKGFKFPEYRFAACCNGHDTCYSTCARGFSECNNEFHDFISSAGGNGEDDAVDMFLEMTRSTIRLHHYRSMKVVAERDVNDTRLSVAQMGPELIQKATIEHPDFEILVVGRSYNPAPSVTFCTFRGFKDPGVDYHMGKIMEYGASCATPKSTSALAIVRKEPSRFEVRPHWPDRRTQTRGYRGHGNKLGFEFDCKIHVHGNNGHVRAKITAQAKETCKLLRTYLMHAPYSHQVATVSNLCDLSLGPACKFCVYHLMEMDDPTKLFPVSHETVSPQSDIKPYSPILPSSQQIRKTKIKSTVVSKFDSRSRESFLTPRPPTGYCYLGDVAAMVRSKNAGPYELTFDVRFTDQEILDEIKVSGVLTKECIAKL
ncbi:hypothetical protein KCU81_g9484, partial [Aureobasidium melanogenum]